MLKKMIPNFNFLSFFTQSQKYPTNVKNPNRPRIQISARLNLELKITIKMAKNAGKWRKWVFGKLGNWEIRVLEISKSRWIMSGWQWFKRERKRVKSGEMSLKMYWKKTGKDETQTRQAKNREEKRRKRLSFFFFLGFLNLFFGIL